MSIKNFGRGFSRVGSLICVQFISETWQTERFKTVLMPRHDITASEALHTRHYRHISPMGLKWKSENLKLTVCKSFDNLHAFVLWFVSHFKAPLLSSCFTGLWETSTVSQHPLLWRSVPLPLLYFFCCTLGISLSRGAADACLLRLWGLSVWLCMKAWMCGRWDMMLYVQVCKAF